MPGPLKEFIIIVFFSTKTYVVGTQNHYLDDSSFTHPKDMLELIGKKIFTNLCL